ncbi:EAL domain-containing protein [Comamonas sp. w2-DMI]|uniref:EAL domain-containing protein n=1 Tax=Comamonas sp. w2-DMI TaxID=3126391 RepID=UPI0032E4955B
MRNDHQNLGKVSREYMVWLCNLEELRLVYGPELQQQALEVAVERLQRQGLSARLAEPKGCSLLASESLCPTEGAETEDQAQDRLERICSAIGREPVTLGAKKAYLQVEAQALGGISLHSMSELHGRSRSVACRRQQPAARNLRPRWRQDYQQDMYLACRLLDDLRLGILAVAFQPVAALNSAGPGPSMYYECLLRRNISAESDGYGVPDAIQALERLGLVERLDRSVLWTALDALVANQEVSLGCNVSARSFASAAWWTEVLVYLEEHPGVAQRLVVEITETSSFPDEKSAQALIRHLQILGVRVALDDIGTQCGSLDILDKVRANIIKLDKSVLEKAAGGQPTMKMLQSVVGVCTDRGVSVIVEGIDSAAALDTALGAGASGAQGYFIAHPSLHLHGLFDQILHVPDVLLQMDAAAYDWAHMLNWSRPDSSTMPGQRMA